MPSRLQHEARPSLPMVTLAWWHTLPDACCRLRAHSPAPQMVAAAIEQQAWTTPLPTLPCLMTSCVRRWAPSVRIITCLVACACQTCGDAEDAHRVLHEFMHGCRCPATSGGRSTLCSSCDASWTSCGSAWAPRLWNRRRQLPFWASCRQPCPSMVCLLLHGVDEQLSKHAHTRRAACMHGMIL